MLKDRVALVTGASLGVGKGIAIALGAAGATVYVTGRSSKAGDNPFGGTVFATAEDVTKRGGRGVAVVCDHSDDEQVRALFKRIEDESGDQQDEKRNADDQNSKTRRQGEARDGDREIHDAGRKRQQHKEE